MQLPQKPDEALDPRTASSALDVLVRAGLILALVWLCYRIFSPFLTLMAWALILAVAMYPLHQAIAARIGGRQGLAATLIVIFGILLIVVPAAVLVTSLGDSIEQLIRAVQHNTLRVPAPRAGVEHWPVVGERLHALWSKAHADLPALVQSMQPQLGDLAKKALGFVAAIGSALLQFLVSYVIAGIVMAFGAAGARTSLGIFERIVGPERGARFVKLSAGTVRAVAQGVIGVAFIQAILVGLIMLVAGVPAAGALALIALLLGIAQIPVLLVTLPVIAYIWWSGDHGNASAIAYSVLLALSGMADNVLKPLMLGRGVDVPMPVILLGALGGMASAGILGLFVGATVLALGYQVFMGWVAGDPEVGQAEPGKVVPPPAG